MGLEPLGEHVHRPLQQVLPLKRVGGLGPLRPGLWQVRMSNIEE